jgi:hypothetical protein
VHRAPQVRIQARFEEEAEAGGRFRPYVPPGPLPGALPLWEPSRETAPGVGVGPRAARAFGGEPTLHPVSRPAAAELMHGLRRQPLDVALGLPLVSPGIQVVQRDVVETPEVPETPEAGEEMPGPDLDDLARQVYPLIKRMLAIERERRLGR